MNKRFKDFVDTMDYLEVLRITIDPDGVFHIPSEKDGKIAQVSPTTRHALGKFLMAKAKELQCPSPAHVKKTGMRRRSDRKAA